MFLPIVLILSLFSLFYRRLRKGFFQRIGIVSIKKFKVQPVWFHCSSLGEFNAIKNIIVYLKRTHVPVVITTLTDTGYMAAERFLEKGNVYMLPLDFNFLILSFVKRLNPRMLIIEETEIWPNLISNTYKKGVPIIYTNCIISQKSFSFYQCFKSIFKKVLNMIDQFFIQNNSTIKYLIQMGVPKKRIEYLGNIKFDIQLKVDTKKQGALKKLDLKNNIVLCAGSTRKGEEKLIIKTYLKLKEEFHNLKLIIVPRHLNRIHKVIKLLSRYKCSFSLYSHYKKLSDIVLFDKMGYLLNIYTISDIAFIGGTLVPVGGHNPIESAYVRCPVISGPYIKNNREAFMKISRNKGGLIVQDSNELYYQLRKLLRNRKQIKTMGQNAYKVLKENQGASKKIVNYLQKRYLKN